MTMVVFTIERLNDTMVPQLTGGIMIQKQLLFATVLSLAALSANAEQVKKNMPACVSEEYLDELITYSGKGDNEGMKQLYMAGKCTSLKAGDPVSVISPGFMTATIRYNGVKMFTPSEAVR